MCRLTEQQARDLGQYRKLLQVAIDELSDSLHTDYMSDSKHAVFKVIRATENLALPNAVTEKLKSMSKEALAAAIGSGDVFDRAGKAIAAIGRIQAYLQAICTPDNRGLQIPGSRWQFISKRVETWVFTGTWVFPGLMLLLFWGAREEISNIDAIREAAEACNLKPPSFSLLCTATFLFGLGGWLGYEVRDNKKKH